MERKSFTVRMTRGQPVNVSKFAIILNLSPPLSVTPTAARGKELGRICLNFILDMDFRNGHRRLKLRL